MRFEDALEFVLEREGGYVNDSQDPGGETKYGISKRSYPNEDIPNLTKEAAGAIYRRDYWDACRCGELPGGVDLCVFDTAVNQGVFAAIKILQRSANVTADGVLGPATMQAAKSASVAEFLAQRMMVYALNANVHRYGLGWYRRVSAVFEAAR